jgi:hypothetical protein
VRRSTPGPAHLRPWPTDPGGADRRERIQELIDTPEQLLGLLEDPEVAGGRLAPLLEVLTRRYYRTRELDTVRTVEVAGGQAVVADFTDPRGHGRVIALAATADDLSESLQATADLASEVDPAAAGAGVVADVYIAWPDAPTELDLLAAGLEADLDDASSHPALRRVTLSLTVAPGVDPDDPERPSVEHLTFRRDDPGTLPGAAAPARHPPADRRPAGPVAVRALRDDPAALIGGTYLFHARAHDNPQDERLFVIAEVRDLTPVRDADGRVVALPELEQVLAAALDDLRRARAASPDQQRPRVEPHHAARLAAGGGPDPGAGAGDPCLAPTTEGLGLEQVMVQARLAAPTRSPRRWSCACRGPRAGLHVARHPAADRAAGTVRRDMTRQVMKARSRGSVYPYELVPLLTRDRAATPTADAGGFVEYDLDGSGRLVPVQRPFGGNRAGIVVGLVTTRPTATRRA